jgi:uncharacterized protein (DUF1015 family)
VATIRPFRALRPRPDLASRIAAVPYDVVSTDEARTLAEGNPLSFLRVSRAEIELPSDTDPYAPAVYARAAVNFRTLRESAFTFDDAPALYLYRLRLGSHEQTGIAGCYLLDEYERGIIRKHERTRRDKEDDRTRHLLALGAQTGPVFLVYKSRSGIDRIVADAIRAEPLIDFEAADGVRHSLWRMDAGAGERLVAEADRIPALYIADGHHRAASAARARREVEARSGEERARRDVAGHTTFLAVAFPDAQVRILPYNRAVKDLGGLSPSEFLEHVRSRFEIGPGPSEPRRKGEIAMYFQGGWYALRPHAAPRQPGTIAALDVTILQEELLAPVLKIGDVRVDPRIEFVGGAKGPGALVRLVDSGAAAVAFSMCAVEVDDLMAISDAGAIMPPKSTWFEPKLRDGLLIHVI